MYDVIYCGITYNGKRLETTQVSINRGLVK